MYCVTVSVVIESSTPKTPLFSCPVVVNTYHMKACWWAPIFAGLFILALLIFATMSSKRDELEE